MKLSQGVERCALNTPAHFTMSSIAAMPVTIFLKALYPFKSHSSQDGNRAWFVSLQQLKRVFFPSGEKKKKFHSFGN
jgi:hypothetical protein